MAGSLLACASLAHPHTGPDWGGGGGGGGELMSPQRSRDSRVGVLNQLLIVFCLF